MHAYLFIMISTSSLLAAKNVGVVISSVSDLIGQPIHKTKATYESLPVAGLSDACPRMHQLLFNETVEILKENDQEYQISIPNIFYITEQNKSPQTTYWTSKKAILPLTTCKSKELDLVIPRPIDFRKQACDLQSPTVILIKPLYNKICDTTFSAGTRFVCSGPLVRNQYTVSALHPKTQKIISFKIPKAYAVQHTEHSPVEARALYNKLLKSWAHTNGFIPYVWGGCSFCYTHADKTRFSVEGAHRQIQIKGDTHKIKCGFDCAGLISRAAQIAGLPYYYKNTATLAANLKPIQSFAELNDGDLIWIPGHVMAIGDLKNGTIIEARHYSQGYGKVHEIAVSKVFKDMHSFAELFQAMRQNKTLKRLDSKGNTVQLINRIKFLAIIS